MFKLVSYQKTHKKRWSKHYCYSILPLSLLLTNTSLAKTPCQIASIGKHEVCLEIADTPQKRQLGLMNRRTLPNNQGMLFTWENSQTRCFWMKNTPINLDIAFLTADFKITSIQSLQANSNKRTCSQQPARYALEMPANWFTKNQISKSDTLNGLKELR